ncbi:MAG: feruloyl esterase, partial [Myxococcales bacterium]|nr:feruloyl esterase [Myxococcales bacterium]
AGAGGGAGGASSGGGGGAPAPSGGCHQSFSPGTLVKTFDVAGVTRQVAFYVPQSYTGTEPLPLIFTLHGSGDSGPSALSSTFADFKKLADTRGFFIAALSGANGLWDVGLDPARPSDPAFATVVLDWVGQNLCLDAKRVFSTGFSGGARESSYLPCALPGRFRAIAPVAGVRHDPPCGMGGVSVMAVHGTADTQNIYAGCTGPCRGGEWGESVEAAVADWVKSDACTGAPMIESVSATVERQTWNACAGGTEVVFYKVAGATHMWNLLPNIATQVVDFFLAR